MANQAKPPFSSIGARTVLRARVFVGRDAVIGPDGLLHPGGMQDWNAAKVAKTALAEEKTIKEVVVQMGFVEQGDLTEEQLDAALDVLAMARGGR